MSAFIVSTETMNCVVSSFAPADNWRGRPQKTAEELNRLGSQLMKLNADAVSQRYREPVDVMTAAKFRYRDKLYSKHQQLKSLHCLIYQCAEGDVPGRKLFKLLKERANELATEIATATPEYNAGKWDF